MGLFSCFKSQTKEEIFWSWFTKNSSNLFSFEKDQEKIFDELSAQMSKVNSDLTFEFGPIENNKRDFVISAGGIKASFPAVEKLYESRPDLKEWNFIKFRPRRATIHTIQFQDIKIAPTDVKFAIFKDNTPNNIGILLFINWYNENDRSKYSQIGYLYLDEIIGEYDVEMSVGAIEIQGFDSKYFTNAQNIDELEKSFDQEKINLTTASSGQS